MEHDTSVYNVGLWEYVYERESQAFKNLLIQKATRLKALKAKDLFSLPESEARQLQKQIGYLESELKQLYSFKVFADEMKNCYSDSTSKIYDAYHSKNLVLEIENHTLKAQLFQLNELYKGSIDETLYWQNFTIKLLELKMNGNGNRG